MIARLRLAWNWHLHLITSLLLVCEAHVQRNSVRHDHSTQASWISVQFRFQECCETFGAHSEQDRNKPVQKARESPHLHARWMSRWTKQVWSHQEEETMKVLWDTSCVEHMDEVQHARSCTREQGYSRYRCGRRCQFTWCPPLISLAMAMAMAHSEVGAMTPQKRICFAGVACSLARCAGTNC